MCFSKETVKSKLKIDLKVTFHVLGQWTESSVCYLDFLLQIFEFQGILMTFFKFGNFCLLVGSNKLLSFSP